MGRGLKLWHRVYFWNRIISLKSTNRFVEGTVEKFNAASIQNQSSKLRAYHNLKLSLCKHLSIYHGGQNFTDCVIHQKNHVFNAIM